MRPDFRHRTFSFLELAARSAACAFFAATLTALCLMFWAFRSTPLFLFSLARASTRVSEQRSVGLLIG